MTDIYLPPDGERFLPEFSGTIRLEHLHRYYVAREISADRDVLDIACGEGYGSEILSSRARSVIGVDINSVAIAHARAAYERPGLSFLEGSATAIPIDDNSVDLIVSFETIEHLTEQEEMLVELKRVLRPGGVLLISSPNKAVYSDMTGYQNPFHLKELYTQEFIDLLASHFRNTRHYGQKTSAASVIASADSAGQVLIYTDAGSSKNVSHQRYDMLFASDGQLPDLPSSIYEIPDSPLQPERCENALRQKDADLAHRLAEYDRLSSEHHKFRHAVGRLIEDANALLHDKWWKRTDIFRRLSNSIRKRRGKAKKN